MPADRAEFTMMIEDRSFADFSKSRLRSFPPVVIVALLSTILATCLGASAASARISNTVIGKCCPCGQVISVSNNFTCAHAVNNDRELYQFSSHANHDTFAQCPYDRNLTITRLSEIGEKSLSPDNTCVDLLYEEENDRSVPIVFRCISNETDEQESSIAESRIAVPKVPTLRLCCGIDRIYDVARRECVFSKKGFNVPRNFRFLDDVLDFATVVRGPPICEHAIRDYTVNSTRDIRVHDDGRLEVVLPAENGSETIMANENNTCLDPGDSTPGLLVLRACSGSSFCNEKSCVRKCCPEDQAIISASCAKIPLEVPTESFHEILHNVSVKRGLDSGMDALDHFEYGMLIGKPCKWGMYPLDPTDKWHMTSRGFIYVPNYKLYVHDEYCMERLYGNPRLPDNIYPVVCFDGPESVDESPIRFGINAALELTSCISLIVTLLVYICLPVLRNIHGKTLMCHVASLILAYACLAGIALGTPSSTGIPGSVGTTICQFLGFTTVLAWISAFSWLNVMCFDIWWTFGGLGGAAVSRGGGRAYGKRFLMYSLYAWGFPLFVTVLGVVLDNTNLVSPNYRPNIGADRCWFTRNFDLYGEIIFFIGPVALQLVANVIFFVLTARYCSRVKAEITKVMATPMDPRSKRYHADRTKFIMNLKLFIVMGVSWIFEMISFFLNHYAVGGTWRVEFFYVSDAFNCLQGVMIFILFVVKRKVYHALRRRFGNEIYSGNTPASNGTKGLRDPFRVRKSASNSTIMSTSALSTSPY